MEIIKLIAIRRSLQISTKESVSSKKQQHQYGRSTTTTTSQQQQQQQQQSPRRRRRERSDENHFHNDYTHSVQRQPTSSRAAAAAAAVIVPTPASEGKTSNNNSKNNCHHHCTFDERVQMSRKRLLHHELHRIHRRINLDSMMTYQQQHPQTATSKTNNDHFIFPSQLHAVIDTSTQTHQRHHHHHHRPQQQQQQQQQQIRGMLDSQSNNSSSKSKLLLRQRPDQNSFSDHPNISNQQRQQHNHDDDDDDSYRYYDTESLIREAKERMEITRKFLMTWKMKKHNHHHHHHHDGHYHDESEEEDEEDESRTTISTNEKVNEDCYNTSCPNGDNDDDDIEGKGCTAEVVYCMPYAATGFATNPVKVECPDVDDDDNDIVDHDDDRSLCSFTTRSTLKGMQFYNEGSTIIDDRSEELSKKKELQEEEDDDDDDDASSSSSVMTPSTSNVLVMMPTTTTCPSDEMSEEHQDEKTTSFAFLPRAVEKEMKSSYSVNSSLEADIPAVEKPTQPVVVPSSNNKSSGGKKGWTLFRKLSKSALRLNQEDYPSTTMTSTFDQSSASDVGVDVCGESATVVASNGVRRSVDDAKKLRRGSSTSNILLCSKSKMAEEEWFVAKAREAHPAGKEDRVMEMVFFD